MYFKSFYRLLKSSNKSKYSSLTVSSIHPEDFGKHWYVNFFSRAQAPSICWPSSIYAPPLSLHSVGFHHFQWRARHVNLSITTMNISHGHNSVHKYVSHCYFLSFYVLTNIFNSPLWLDNGERLRLECQNNHTLEHTYFILKRWSERYFFFFFFFDASCVRLLRRDDIDWKQIFIHFTATSGEDCVRGSVNVGVC